MSMSPSPTLAPLRVATAGPTQMGADGRVTGSTPSWGYYHPKGPSRISEMARSTCGTIVKELECRLLGALAFNLNKEQQTEPSSAQWITAISTPGHPTGESWAAAAYDVEWSG